MLIVMKARRIISQFLRLWMALAAAGGIVQQMVEPAWADTTTSAAPQHAVTTILFLGDSLTEGYGVKKEQAYPELVGRILNESKRPVKVINGSISGSVTADADQRLRWFLKSKPDVLVLALGSNDALKGTAPEVIEKNLGRVIDLAKENKIRVLLCGVQVFTNFGAEYNHKLEKTYRDLAKTKKIELMPFLLEGVALDKDLNQADGKHPNAKGHEVIASHVAKRLEKLL